jgi:amino acid transporter
MRRLAFLIYAWGSTALFGFLIYWLATIPNFQASNSISDDLVKVVFRMILYAIFFILLYRSLILTLKSTVVRLASFRSKNERAEDAEFVLVIETLVVVLCIAISILFAFFEEQAQLYTPGRNGTETFLVESNGEYFKSESASPVLNATYINISSIGESNKDILVSVLSVLLTAMVAYSAPVIGELEYALKHKISRRLHSKK